MLAWISFRDFLAHHSAAGEVIVLVWSFLMEKALMLNLNLILRCKITSIRQRFLVISHLNFIEFLHFHLIYKDLLHVTRTGDSQGTGHLLCWSRL
jgi:hypothetical protein